MSAQQTDRLSALFEVHADRLYRLARRLVPGADDALDLLQETFLKAARSPESVPRGLRSSTRVTNAFSVLARFENSATVYTVGLIFRPTARVTAMAAPTHIDSLMYI